MSLPWWEGSWQVGTLVGSKVQRANWICSPTQAAAEGALQFRRRNFLPGPHGQEASHFDHGPHFDHSFGAAIRCRSDKESDKLKFKLEYKCNYYHRTSINLLILLLTKNHFSFHWQLCKISFVTITINNCLLKTIFVFLFVYYSVFYHLYFCLYFTAVSTGIYPYIYPYMLKKWKKYTIINFKVAYQKWWKACS